MLPHTYSGWQRHSATGGTGPSPSLAEARVLRRIFNKAVEWHGPKKGVFLLDKAPPFDLLKGANKRDRVVTFKEETSYMEKARINSPLLADFAAQLFDAALRAEEGYRLRCGGYRLGRRSVRGTHHAHSSGQD